jgi:hypothetical protein
MVQSESSANRKRGGVAHCGIGGLTLGLVHNGLGSLTPRSLAQVVSARCTASKRVVRKRTGTLCVRGASESQMQPILTEALSNLLCPVVSSGGFPLVLQSVDSFTCLSEEGPRAEWCRYCNRRRYCHRYCYRCRSRLHYHWLARGNDAPCSFLGFWRWFRNRFWLNCHGFCNGCHRLFPNDDPLPGRFVQRSLGPTTSFFRNLLIFFNFKGL